MRAFWVVAMAGVLGLAAACGATEQPTPGTRTPTTPAHTPGEPGTPMPTPPTGPPASEPPASEPPATQPPATAPPTTSPDPGQLPTIAYEPVTDGFSQLTFLTHAGDGSGLIYVVEQRGVIHAGSPAGAFQPEPFLDITDRVLARGEQGLLGLAFHPDYADNGRLFVNYSNREGDNVIAEFRHDAELDGVDESQERQLLVIGQPFANHNGGMLAFGADGMLYVSSGDGGGGGDPLGAGQDLSMLLGKILRLDVDAEEPYAIPADNPFAGAGDEARAEIWSYGLRNPWRFSFDRATGDMFIGDVGQNRWEEVNAEPAGVAGRNYGWNRMEGPECYLDDGCPGMTGPVAWYPTRDGCAVTGGYVYRGELVAGLEGAYLFADYCSGEVWALSAAEALAGDAVEMVEMGNAGISVTSFGEDEAGELYLVGAGGEVLRVTAAD